MNNRRKVVLGLGVGALAWAGVVRAQAPANVRRIGLLSPHFPSDSALWHQAFRQDLRDLGWIEGKNISIEYRYAEGKRNRLPDLAADLVRLKVDIIVAAVHPAVMAAKKATREIPIVMAGSGDPVASGLVVSLARPGGNITGLSQMNPQLAGKRLEMLKEIVPTLSRVAVLWNPRNPGSIIMSKALQIPARDLEIELHSLEVRSSNDLDKAFEDATRARAGALFIMADPMTVTNLNRIASLAATNRLPSIFQTSEFADVGGLIAYGPDRVDMYRRAAGFVDKILKGAKPADLPVEQPTRFELVVNMKTAKALGLTMPPEIMVRATRVIQ